MARTSPKLQVVSDPRPARRAAGATAAPTNSTQRIVEAITIVPSAGVRSLGGTTLGSFSRGGGLEGRTGAWPSTMVRSSESTISFIEGGFGAGRADANLGGLERDRIVVLNSGWLGVRAVRDLGSAMVSSLCESGELAVHVTPEDRPACLRVVDEGSTTVESASTGAAAPLP